jgi:hypothetical protein
MHWLIITPAVLAALYALHRFCLRLEEQGYLYYWHKRPKGGGAAMFMPLQEFLEPQMKHVFHIEEQQEKITESKRGDDDRAD